MFLDEGPPMAQLLREAAARGIMPDYTGKLLAAFEAEQQGAQANRLSLSHSSPASQSLIEPLSQREFEILRLFKTELSGPEIAQRTRDRLEHGPHPYQEHLQQTQCQ